MTAQQGELSTTRPTVLYLRRSTSLQDQSIESQRDYLLRYATDHDLEVVSEYVDDAISGTTVEGRSGFQRMIADAQGKVIFRAILCYDVKRFSRGDLDEVGHYRYVLKNKGIDIIYATEEFKDDFAGDLMRPIRQVMARQESVDLSKVTLRGHLSSINSGFYIGGVPPYGYDYFYTNAGGSPIQLVRYRETGEKDIYAPDGRLIRRMAQGERLTVSRQDRIKLVPSLPERVEVVKRIFREYVIEQKGCRSIAFGLTAEGVPSPRCGKWGGTSYDGKWAISTVHNMIKNQTYCGDTVWNRRTEGKFHRVSDGVAVPRPRNLAGIARANPEEDWVVIKNTHEPLIPRAMLAAATRIRLGRDKSENVRHLLLGRGRTSNFLLAGLIRCTHCGNRFHGYSQKLRKRTEVTPQERHQTYVCGGYIRKGPSVCSRYAIEKVPFETFVVEEVYRRLLQVLHGDGGRLLRSNVSGEIERAISQPRQELARARKEHATLKVEADRLLRNLTEVNREFIDERLVEIKNRRRDLERRAVALEGTLGRQIDPEAAVDAAMGRLSRFRVVLEAGSFIEQKEFLRCFVIGIDMDPKLERGVLHMHNTTSASFSSRGWTPDGTKKTHRPREWTLSFHRPALSWRKAA